LSDRDRANQVWLGHGSDGPRPRSSARACPALRRLAAEPGVPPLADHRLRLGHDRARRDDRPQREDRHGDLRGDPLRPGRPRPVGHARRNVLEDYRRIFYYASPYGRKPSERRRPRSGRSSCRVPGLSRMHRAPRPAAASSTDPREGSAPPEAVARDRRVAPHDSGWGLASRPLATSATHGSGLPPGRSEPGSSTHRLLVAISASQTVHRSRRFGESEHEEERP
jgi:hypothetical protein